MHLIVPLLLLVSMPPTLARAECRLSARDCLIIYNLMSDEAYASDADTRHFHPAGKTPSERAAELERRHLDRMDERSITVSTQVGKEWERLDACADPENDGNPTCR